MSLQKDLLPSNDELAFFDKNGWLLTKLFIKHDILETCKKALEEVYAGYYDFIYPWSSHEDNPNFRKLYNDRSQPRMDAHLSLHKDQIKTVVHSQPVAAYASRLMNASVVRLYRDISLTMPPSSRGTGWHVDKNYWPTCSSDKLLSAWFSLDDCGIQNGCLSAVSGSHRWKQRTFIKKIDINDISKIKKLYSKEEFDVVSIPHKRGQISFHSCLLVHGAHPNLSQNTRQSFAVVYQDGGNRHLPLKNGSFHKMLNFNTNDRIGPKDENGLPDYQNSEFYPVLFE